MQRRPVSHLAGRGACSPLLLVLQPPLLPLLLLVLLLLLAQAQSGA
jgi:hypothetical protein